MGAYRANTDLLGEHFGIEQTMLAGGYGYRQILELVQNGADAILEANELQTNPESENRIHVVLRDDFLYVANTGAPLSEKGIGALLSSHDSPKRGNEIGRFGLGFKSLLRLEGCIDIITRSSGGMRFDPKRCRQELQREFKASKVPGLRMAWPLEKSQCAADTELALFPWAETVIRVTLTASDLHDHLREEIQNFPAEFLLFFPVSTNLTLDGGERGVRELKLAKDGDFQVLHDGDSATRWRVARRDVTITDPGAISDATDIHARASSVPIAWAVPVDAKREESGRFWAFFPTRTPSYVAGIVNAPWKLNTNRNAISQGRWNDVLMVEAARLIADTLPSLASADDPGRLLDAFPRQLERKDEDAAPLVEELWKLLSCAKVVPDATGLLRQARDLWRHPIENILLVKRWHEIVRPENGSKFVHPSCLERQRNSRLNILAERLTILDSNATRQNLRKCTPASWFGEVASIAKDVSVQVLFLAENYKEECKGYEWSSICQGLAIIPSQCGQLITAGKAVFAPEGIEVPGYRAVVTSLASDVKAKRILTSLMGVKELDDSFWLSEIEKRLPKGADPQDDEHWQSWWALFRKIDESVTTEFIEYNADEIRFRRRDGKWVFSKEVLLPGELVCEDDLSENSKVLLDTEFHYGDSSFIERLGVSDCPNGDDDWPDNTEFSEWLSQCKKLYKDAYNNSARRDYLYHESFQMPKSWMLLRQLNGLPNARLTRRLLRCILEWPYHLTVSIQHSTTPTRYDKLEVAHPLLWYVMKYGMLQIGSRVVRLAVVVGRNNVPVIACLKDWDEVKPALKRLEQAEPKLLQAKADIQAMWRTLIDVLAVPTALESDALESLWCGAALDDVIPKNVRALDGETPLSNVYVSLSPDLARRARTRARLVFTLDEKTLVKWVKSGAKDLSELIEPKFEPAGAVDRLVAVLPELSNVLKAKARDSARCQTASGLVMTIEESSTPIPCVIWEDRLLLDSEQLSHFTRAERLKLLLDEIATADWLDSTPEVALQCLGDAHVDELRAQVAAGASLPERLLRAVGERRQPLLDVLGSLKDMSLVRACTPLQLADLALAHLGPAILSELKTTLEAQGLKPPGRWNTSEAFTFVASIGFPDDFASAPQTKREAEEYISGPIDLLDLHDFQREVLEGIEELLASDSKRRRAVISLPTGGGKTRVTVEAAVRLVLRPETWPRNLLWVAQTDELCEQAVQAFRQVWINLGARNTDLRIVRLWGGNPTPAIKDSDKPVVVVASIQTLNSRIGDEEFRWLRKPGLVVLDECHHAITPSYTNVLRWLDSAVPTAQAVQIDEPPIIGLSATPFRTDDEESRRLAKRFENHWLPAHQDDLHVRLRAQGVLAEIENEALVSGVALLDEELERLGRLPESWEGLDFENIIEGINQRLAGDSNRNEQLVEYVRNSSAQSILFFTNSVTHAEEMAARLHLVGITAAAVSGDTPTVARRYFLNRFQRGEIRVICNHSVLSTGFDAPRTDMVLIARQVFSPVRYMQMVGRGLRGEKNGGTKSCRIVTVLDNLGRFQERHSYHYCQRYFTESTQ
jgi:superfamily II DNA or RNA helicase